MSDVGFSLVSLKEFWLIFGECEFVVSDVVWKVGGVLICFDECLWLLMIL